MPPQKRNENWSFWWRLKAHFKGDVLGIVLTQQEYYYLMFGCINQKCIDMVKKDGERLKFLIENKLPPTLGEIR